MIRLEADGGIARLDIADVSALSRHDAAAGEALQAALCECDERDDIKVVVISAPGADFCPPSAADATPGDERTWRRIYAGSTGIYQLLCYSKKITITAVQGRCTDAGTALVLCSDLTLATPDAHFVSPFASLPEANFVLAALTMRLGRVKAWMFGALTLDAPAALQAGLINRIVSGDVRDAAMEAARIAALMPLDGIAMSKLMLESCMDAQGVGQDFDMAEFYRAALPHGAEA